MKSIGSVSRKSLVRSSGEALFLRENWSRILRLMAICLSLCWFRNHLGVLVGEISDHWLASNESLFGRPIAEIWLNLRWTRRGVQLQTNKYIVNPNSYLFHLNDLNDKILHISFYKYLVSHLLFTLYSNEYPLSKLKAQAQGKVTRLEKRIQQNVKEIEMNYFA